MISRLDVTVFNGSHEMDANLGACNVKRKPRSEHNEPSIAQPRFFTSRWGSRALIDGLRGPVRPGESGLGKENWHRLLVFVHIPKAAGTSLNDVLRRVYGRTFLQFHRRVQDFDIKSVTPDMARNILALSAHMPYGFHRKLGPKPHRRAGDGLFEGRSVSYISVVRDPVERLYSFYRYVTVTPAHILHHETKGMDCRTFFEYLAETGNRSLGDQQCALINGRRADAQSAIRNIEENYLAVVTLENISGLVSYLERTLKWPAGNVQIGVHNRTSNRNDPEELRIVRQFAERYSAEDLALFEHVREDISPRFC